MPADTTFPSPTSSDAEIIASLETIAKEMGQDPQTCLVEIRIMNGSNLDPSFPLSEIQTQSFVEHAQQHDGVSWERVTIHFQVLNLHLSVTRNWTEGDDHIQIRYTSDPSDPVDVRQSIVVIQKQFTPRYRSVEIEKVLGPEMAEFYRRREEGLSRLEELTRNLVTDTHRYRRQLDDELAQRKQELSESFDKRKQRFDIEHEEQTDDLKSRERDLEELRRELDDRSARHARREQSRALQAKISERSQKFTLTMGTQRKRWPVHTMFCLLLLLSGGLIVHSLLSTVSSTEGVALWLELGRLPLGVVGFAFAAIFYIRWNDQWFRQHADQEFRLQQLALDVDRAGYATEMLLEWQEDKEGQMPAVMLDRLTAGLFTDQTTTAAVRHPSEDVAAALLKAASGVRLDLPGIGEVTLTGRQVRRLDKRLAKNRDD